jgi:hypothetical protein
LLRPKEVYQSRLLTTLVAYLVDSIRSAWLRLKVKLGRGERPLVETDPWYELFEDLLLFLDDLVKNFKEHHVELIETSP